MLVEIVDDDLRVAIAFEVDDDAGVLGALIADIAYAGENFFVREVGDALHEIRAIHVVRDLGDDDLLATTPDFGDAYATAHLYGSSACFKVLFDSGRALQETACRKIGPLDVLHEPFDRDIGVLDLGADAVDALAKVVRRDVSGHAHGDACAAIDKEVRKCRWKNGRFLPGFVVVRTEVDGTLVHVGHEGGAEMLEAGFRITHRGGRIAFHGTEVTLSVDEHFAHRPGLRHVNEGWIDRLVAVRMVVTHRLTDDFRALEVFAVRLDTEFIHRKQNSALRGFQAVAGIREGARNNDRHRVVEKRLRHFIGHINEFNFFVLGIHGLAGQRFGKNRNEKFGGGSTHPAIGGAKRKVLGQVAGRHVDRIHRAHGYIGVGNGENPVGVSECPHIQWIQHKFLGIRPFHESVPSALPFRGREKVITLFFEKGGCDFG